MSTAKPLRTQMRKAYALIDDYKRGAISPGSPISGEQEKLLRLLADDLHVPHMNASVEALVLVVARADSQWNKRTMSLLVKLDDLRRSGKVVEVEARRRAFLRKCPSAWYCGLVSAG